MTIFLEKDIVNLYQCCLEPCCWLNCKYQPAETPMASLGKRLSDMTGI